jgi:hypothetical protein
MTSLTKEQNVHVALMYALPINAVDIKVMAGPTFFKLKQDFRVARGPQRDLPVRHRNVRQRDNQASVRDGRGIQRRC